MYQCGRETFLFLAYSPRDSEGLLAGNPSRNLNGLEHVQNHSVLSGKTIAELRSVLK
jgi:hypothetical protein